MAGERASKIKSDATLAMLQKVFSERTKGRQNFRLAYAYAVKRKLLSAKITNFVLAFKPEKREMILIQIDADGNPVADRIQLDEMDITHAEKTARGGYLIDSKQLKKPTELFVLASMPDSAEITYQMPVNQEQQAAEFAAMMEEICR